MNIPNQQFTLESKLYLMHMTKVINHTFQLKEGQPYIQLNKLLQILQIAQTGGHAKLIIQNKEVLVNGSVETQIRKKLKHSDVVLVSEQSIVIE